MVNGDSHISGCQNSKTPEPIYEKIGEAIYVGDKSPQAKIQNDRPFGVVAAYNALNMFILFLVFLSFSLFSFDPKFCLRHETKPHSRFLRGGFIGGVIAFLVG